MSSTFNPRTLLSAPVTAEPESNQTSFAPRSASARSEISVPADLAGTAGRLLLTGVVVCGFLLRVYCLGAKNLWLDEMWSVVVARMPLHSVLWSIQNQDPNGALYDLLLHFWMSFGQSEAAIRSSALVCGVALIPVMYLLGKQFFNKSVGLIAAALVAVNLFHIQYSQEARAYSLVVLLVSLSSLFLARYFERPSWGSWVGYVLASTLAMYAHIFAVLVIGAQCASLLFLPRRAMPWKGLFGAALTSGLGALPLAVLVLQRMRAPFVALNWIPRPSVRRVYDLFYSLAGNANYYGIEIKHTIAGRLLLAMYGLACLATLLIAIRLWIAKRQSHETWGIVFLLAWLLLPVTIVLVFSILFQSWFLNRYLLICLPALLLLTAKAVFEIRVPWLRGLAIAALLLAGLAGLPQYYSYRMAYQEWKDATDYIVTNERPGDGAMFCVAHGRLLFEYYRDKNHSNQAGDLDLVYPDLKNETTDPRALSYFPPLSSEQLNAIMSQHRRVWFVLYPDDWAPGFDTSRTVEKAIVANYSRVEETHRFTVTIRLYSRDGNLPETAQNLAATK